jgi:hypothetical protein
MTGFGLSGRWFGIDHLGVRPDVLVAAKGATSGYAATHCPMVCETPRILLIGDLGDDRARLWMEDVAAPPAAWDIARYQMAARALGRLAGRFLAAFLPARAAAARHRNPGLLPAAHREHRPPGAPNARTWEYPFMRDALAVDPGLHDDLLSPGRRRPRDPRCARWPAADACPLVRKARRTSSPIPNGLMGSSR